MPPPVPVRAFAVSAAAIVALDLAQPLVLGWQPGHVAALGGAALYAVLGISALRGSRVALWIGLAMPAVPLSVVAAWAVGLELPVRPHAPMVAVLGVQLVAAGAAAWCLRKRGD